LLKEEAFLRKDDQRIEGLGRQLMLLCGEEQGKVGARERGRANTCELEEIL